MVISSVQVTVAWVQYTPWDMVDVDCATASALPRIFEVQKNKTIKTYKNKKRKSYKNKNSKDCKSCG